MPSSPIEKARQPAGLFFGLSRSYSSRKQTGGQSMRNMRRREAMMIGGAVVLASRGRARAGAAQAGADRGQPFRRLDGRGHAQGLLQRLREEVRHPGGRDEPGRLRQAARHGRIRQRRMGRHRDRRPGRDPRHQDEPGREDRRQDRRPLEVSREGADALRLRLVGLHDDHRLPHRRVQKRQPAQELGRLVGRQEVPRRALPCATIRPTISSSRCWPTA